MPAKSHEWTGSQAMRNRMSIHALAGKLGGRGQVVRFLSGVETQEVAIELIGLAGPGSKVVLFGYTLDRDDLVSALVASRGLGAEVRVGLDQKQTLEGKTRDQPTSVLRLMAEGIPVRKVSGVNATAAYAAVGRQVGMFSGALHAKGLRVDDYVILGSGNWTTASRANLELGCLIFVPKDETGAKTPVEEMFERMWESGVDFSAEEVRQAETGARSGRR
jgi:phosphatidylserine/phosphatidylglycerophosphate/cardiolipin synthase-like enzyme